MHGVLTRRDLLIGVGTLAAAPALLDTADAAQAAAPPERAAQQRLADAAGACREAGLACLAHCLASLRSGDTLLAGCATAVQEMVAACDATGQLASYGARRLAPFAAACAQVCADCERECRRHEETHAACRVCAETCARFIVAARDLGAAPSGA